MSQIKALFAAWRKHGLSLPQAYDPAEGKQSFRLLIAYASFMLACVSVMLLHIWPSLLVPCLTTMTFFALCMIFYMLKKLTSAKIDLNDQEISLNGEKELDK